MNGITINIGGYPRVTIDGRAVAFATRQDLGLLCYLALNEGPHSRDKLVGLLWPGYDHDHGFTSLRGSLSRLRRHLDRQLDARRATIELFPVTIERGHGVAFDGFTINPVYDAWLANIRHQAGMVVPSCERTAKSEISHIIDFCQRTFFPLVYRNAGADLVLANYPAIVRAFCAAPDGPELLVVSRLLYQVARYAGRNVETARRLLATRETSSDDQVLSSILAAQSLLALVYALPVDYAAIVNAADVCTSSPRILTQGMIAATLLSVALKDKKILVAAEQAQVMASCALASGAPERIGAVVTAARCAAMASQWAISRSYLSIAHALINEYGSYHLLPSCAAIQKRIDTYA